MSAMQHARRQRVLDAFQLVILLGLTATTLFLVKLVQDLRLDVQRDIKTLAHAMQQEIKAQAQAMQQDSRASTNRLRAEFKTLLMNASQSSETKMLNSDTKLLNELSRITAELDGQKETQGTVMNSIGSIQESCAEISLQTSQILRTRGAVDYATTYLGNGIVMCYVQTLGLHMFLEGADKGMTPHLCRGVGWEADTSAVFERLINPGDYVLDVGTNVGYYTLMFGRRVGPQGKVLGIEASPRTFEIASHSLEVHGYLATNTRMLHRAVFSQDGKTVQITADKRRPLNNHVSLTNEEDASMKDFYQNVSNATLSTVATITIDTALEEWDKVDFVKIDVEGAEAEAYKGMTKTIARFRNAVFVIEVNTLRLGPKMALHFYQSMQKDFKQLRRIVGSEIKPTTVDELMASTGDDDLVVLSQREVL